MFMLNKYYYYNLVIDFHRHVRFAYQGGIKKTAILTSNISILYNVI